MRHIEQTDFSDFSPEIFIVDEDFDAEMSLPDYNEFIEIGHSTGNYYE